jgi:hypothetical protein
VADIIAVVIDVEAPTDKNRTDKARDSAAKIIVRYHIGEPNEVTSDLGALAYFNDIFKRMVAERR